MPDFPRPEGEATPSRRSTDLGDPELARMWLAYQDQASEADRTERHRRETLAALTGGSEAPGTVVPPPPGTPAPEHTPTATSEAAPAATGRHIRFAEAPRTRFIEELDPETPVSVVGPAPLPAPARTPSAPENLLDRAKRVWQAAKPWVDRAVQFAKDKPWVAGMAAGAVMGAVMTPLAPLAGAVMGAAVGAAAGAGVQYVQRRSRERQFAAPPAPRTGPGVASGPPRLPPPGLGPDLTQTRAAGPDRPRSQQLDGPARSETHRTGLSAGGEVAALAARRANGTDRTASSGTSRNTAARPGTAVARPSGRRHSK